MKRSFIVGLMAVLSLYIIMAGCKKKNPQPLSEKIAHVWTAQQVAESGSTVYTKGAANNIRDYSKFTLDLSNATNVTITYQNGDVSRGTWALNGDSQLILSNLDPRPTTTSGPSSTLTYAINSASDTQLVISRSDTDLKTGATSSTYTLTKP